MSNPSDVDYIQKALKQFFEQSSDFSANSAEAFFEPFKNVSNINFFLKKKVDSSFYGYNESMAEMSVSSYLGAVRNLIPTIKQEIDRKNSLTPLHSIKFGAMTRNLDAHPSVVFQGKAEVFF